MEELKKCPFCGGTANIVRDYSRIKPDVSYMFAQCVKCRAETKAWRFGSQEQAELNMERAKQFVTKVWNRRVSDNDDHSNSAE